MAKEYCDTRSSIRTKYIGPTNHRGSRVSVSCDYGMRPRMFVNWDESLNSNENHRRAAELWLDKYIPGTKVSGPGLGFDACYYWSWEVR